METIPFETREGLYDSAKCNDNVDQLRKVYKGCYQEACKKVEYYQERLLAVCRACDPEHHKVVATILDDYEGLALDYLEYGLELEEGTHSNFINQGE